jgi:predicted transcriptional regulator
MNPNNPASSIMRTNCTIIEAIADFEIVKSVFDYFPYQYLPVVEGLRFVGVIMRDEFYQKYITSNEQYLTASELITKEIIYFSSKNTIAQAKEIFDTHVFDLIAVTDEDGYFAGMIHREDVEASFSQNEKLKVVLAELRKMFSFLSL